MLNKVSIIICYYNASSKLKKTIAALKEIDNRGLENLELILVDNNSSDNSKQVITECLKGFTKFSWLIVDEFTPGLSNARIKGIKAAKYEVLLFCDDDNWLSKDYLINGLKILNSDSQIGILGGKGTAVSDIEIPDWLFEVQNYFAVGPQMPESGFVKGKRNVVYGAGMFIRKSYFQNILDAGFSSFSLDRTGKKLSSGGDSEICLVFQVAGYKIWYDKNLTFSHYIEPERLSNNYLNKLKKGIANSRFLTRFYLDYLQGYRPKINTLFWIKELYHTFIGLFKVIFTWNKIEFYRSISFCIFLIQQRSNYNKKVKEIYDLCESLSKLQKL